MSITVQETAGAVTAEENSASVADGFYRLWSEGEAYFVTVTGDRVQFRGRDLALSVAECLADGDRFEPVEARAATVVDRRDEQLALLHTAIPSSKVSCSARAGQS